MKLKPVQNYKNNNKVHFGISEKNLETLKRLSEILEKTKGKPVSDNFFKKEAESLKKIREENKRINESIKMTWETFTRPFDL